MTYEPPPDYVPTLEEIAEGCRLVQAGWSEAVRLRRAVMQPSRALRLDEIAERRMRIADTDMREAE